jgi:methylated-DNA-[protein]-cysteine S-methyltransferase
MAVSNRKAKGKRDDVYSLLCEVPKGKVTTYAELARAACTHPRAVAVFMKTNKHPDAIPCFRVVNSDGSVGGYSGTGGVKRKISLLEENGIAAKNGRVDLKKHMHSF